MEKTIELNNDFLCLKAIEIKKIPSLSIVENDYSENTNIEDEYRKDFGVLLSEIYNAYKHRKISNPSLDVSFELLWITAPVENQAFKANIRLILVFRAVSNLLEDSRSAANKMWNAYASSLKMHKYSFNEIDINDVKSSINVIDCDEIISVEKSAREEVLNNPMMPVGFAFDYFSTFSNDPGNISRCLIDHPHNVISIQLIPTMYSANETNAIIQYAQVLDTLSRGIMTQGVGNVSVSSASSLAETYKVYQANKNNALFSLNILVMGNDRAEIASKVQGYLTADPSVPIGIKNEVYSSSEISFLDEYYASPWLINEAIENRNSMNSSFGMRYRDFIRLPYIITAEEASGLFKLPIGSLRVNAGFVVNESEVTNKTYDNNLINAGDINIGKLKSSEMNSIGVSLKDLTKHMLVVGTPGSGKTTFSISLLDRLWKDYKIPFLVIEPAKNEYRALIQSIPDLQVFTPGKNFISPFVFNPFIPPKNVKLETYKSTLKTAFSAAVSMSTPLDKIFEESINNCYSDFRWLDTYTVDDKGEKFNISDFIKCFQNTFDQIGYTGDARNIGRAGVVRLNSLVNLFDNYYSIPIEDILEKPTVIELAAIENGDQKALIISLILLSILAYVNSNYVGDGKLKNVILLEEAHVLLDADSNAGQGEANPSAIAQGLLKRMLAEIRSYGVGMIVADQSPRKVTTDVVALTDMKMVFRLVESTDKEIISDSINMDEAQVKRLSRLKPGEAFVFFNRLDEPEEVITPDYRLEHKIDITLSDSSIKELSKYWNDKKQMLRPFPECKYIKCCSEECDYERRILAKEIARRIYAKNFRADSTEFSLVIKVFSHITSLIQNELGDIELTHELFLCIKCHLWRRIKYGTKIRITSNQIMNSLSK